MTTTLEKPTVHQPVVEPPQIESVLSETLQSEPLHFEEPTRRLWTRADYHKAGELGFFGMEERLELINGEVWKKVSPQSVPHSSATVLTGEALRSAFGANFHVREEKPIVLNDLTEPEPDVVVVRGTARQLMGHPTVANAVLVMEVSETTLKFDQTYKAEAYARSGIPDYWVLNQRARQLEVRRQPGLLGDGQWGYRSLQIVSDSGQVSPLAAPNVVINVADLLPSLPAPSSTTEANDPTPDTTNLQANTPDAPQND